MSSRVSGSTVSVARQTADELVGLPVEDYVARLCRAVRNSAHGLLSTLRQSPDRFLLARHTGDVPTEFTWLAATVMFALVADADRLVDGTWAAELRG